MLTGNNWLFVRQVDSNYDVIFLEHYRLDVLLLGSLAFSFSLATTNFIENHKMIDGVSHCYKSESLLNPSMHHEGGGEGVGGEWRKEHRSQDCRSKYSLTIKVAVLVTKQAPEAAIPHLRVEWISPRYLHGHFESHTAIKAWRSAFDGFDILTGARTEWWWVSWDVCTFLAFES